MKLIKKNWTIFFNCPQKKNLQTVTITTDMGLMSVLTHFSCIHAPKDTIVSIHSEEVKKDSLIEFLDNNPPKNENTPLVKPMTIEEELAYNQGYYDAETANFKQQMIALGEWQ